MKKLILILFSFSVLTSYSQVSKKISQETSLSPPYGNTVFVRVAKTGYNYKVEFDQLANWMHDNYVLADTVSTLATQYDLK